MKQYMKKHFGQSWKTTIVSYLLAAMLAVQPLLDASADLGNRQERMKYIFRLAFAAGVALLGKYAADSNQVKQINSKTLSENKD
jgi:hypothetical protein